MTEKILKREIRNVVKEELNTLIHSLDAKAKLDVDYCRSGKFKWFLTIREVPIPSSEVININFKVNQLNISMCHTCRRQRAIKQKVISMLSNLAINWVTQCISLLIQTG